MVTCKQRTEARSITLPQFHAVGLRPIVFESACEPASVMQLNETAERAIRFAARVGEGMLYIEDDIDLNPELFLWAVDKCESLNAVTYFYLNDFNYCITQHYGSELVKAIKNKESIRRDAYPIHQRFKLYGTQCVFIPARLLPTMIQVVSQYDRRRPHDNAWDNRLQQWLIKNQKEKVFTILPHPVQHRQAIAGWEDRWRNEMRSMSYDLPWHD